jgi:F-type H+-transporting ATPase subunit delta
MLDLVIARRYARALYKLSYAQGEVARVLASLGDFAKIFAEREDLRRVLKHPAVATEDKINLIKKIVEGQIALDFLRFLLEKGRFSLLPLIYDEFLRVYRDDAGIVAAEITSALPLADDLKKRLVALLGRLTGKRVELGAVVDDGVIGGLRLRVGDHVVDGTLAARLKDMGETLAGAAPGTGGAP